MKVYHFDSVLADGRYRGKTVQEVFESHPNFIFQTLKRWATNKAFDNTFDDEVLAAANITKIEHEHRGYQDNNFVDKDTPDKQKKLKKDNKSIDEIFDEMDSERYNYAKYDKEDAKQETETDGKFDIHLEDGFTIVKEDDTKE